MRSEPARLSVISLDFAGIPARCDGNFQYEHAEAEEEQVGIEFSLISFVLFSDSFVFVFQLVKRYENICSA